MLSFISWSAFLQAAGASTACYYLALLLLCYRRETRQLLTRHKAPSPVAPASPDSLLGPLAPEEGSRLSEAVAIRVAPPRQAAPAAEVLPALLAEAQSLLAVAVDAGAGKEEFLSLLGLFAAKHASRAEAAHREALHHFLLTQEKSRLRFALTPADLQSLWPATA